MCDFQLVLSTYEDFNIRLLDFGSELLDGCRALVGIASLLPPSTFDQLLRSNARFVGVFEPP